MLNWEAPTHCFSLKKQLSDREVTVSYETQFSQKNWKNIWQSFILPLPPNGVLKSLFISSLLKGFWHLLCNTIHLITEDDIIFHTAKEDQVEGHIDHPQVGAQGMQVAKHTGG